jgi:quercetin dioxygenase-like cupin family protein
MPYLISLSEELAKDSKPRRLLASTPGWKLLLLDLRHGGEIPVHSAPGPITVHCLEGQAEFAIGEVWNLLKAGDIQALEANVPHAVRAPLGAVLLVHLISAA